LAIRPEPEFYRKRKFGLISGKKHTNYAYIQTYITYAVHERTITDTNKKNKTAELSQR